MAVTEPVRRFYDVVDVAEVGGTHRIRLDGREVKTPRGAPVVLPTQAMAQLIADEWRAQGERIAPDSMPAARLANTVLDAPGGQGARSATEIVGYAETDLVCYRADNPASLVASQKRHWDPLLEWARTTLHLPFVETEGLIHRPQPPGVAAGVAALVRGLDDFTLAGLAFGSALFGSAVIALALRAARLTSPEAVEAARVDEAHQQARWGVDELAAAQLRRLRRDADMLAAWFRALDRRH